MIVEYVRKGGRKKTEKIYKDGKCVGTKRGDRRGGCRIGVLVAVPSEDKVKIGWTLCNVKAGDKFDKDFGLQVAIDRAIKDSKYPIAQSLIKKAEAFIHRAGLYYKDKVIQRSFEWSGQPSGRKVEHVDAGC
jgi:hypothetical protein